MTLCLGDFLSYCLGAYFFSSGNPGSFHSEFARWKREAITAAVMPLFEKYIHLDQPGEWEAARTVPYNADARQV
jgi:hypothetical protein